MRRIVDIGLVLMDTCARRDGVGGGWLNGLTDTGAQGGGDRDHMQLRGTLASWRVRPLAR